MNDAVVIAIVTALGGIISAAITAYFGYKIELDKTEFKQKKKNPKNKKAGAENKEDASPRGIVKNAQSEENRRPRFLTTSWKVLVLLAFVLGGAITYSFLFATQKPTEPSVSLSDAKIEFRIKIDDSNTNTISADIKGGIQVLHEGDVVEIETIVTDIKGNAYPHTLEFTYNFYYFASAKEFSGNVLLYTASQPDTITVKIKDQITGEDVTRGLRIEIK